MTRILLSSAAAIAMSLGASFAQTDTDQTDSSDEAMSQSVSAGDQAEKNENAASTVANEHFAAMDSNNNGAVSKTEFVSFIANADNVTREEAQRLFDAAAGDDKQLTLAEFTDNSNRLAQISADIARPLPADAPRAASVSQSQNDGSQDAKTRAADQSKVASADKKRQSAEEAREAVPMLAKVQPVGDPQVMAVNADMFRAMDENGDGVVRKSEYLEFVRMQAEKQFDEMAGQDDSLAMSEFRNADHDLLRHARDE